MRYFFIFCLLFCIGCGGGGESIISDSCPDDEVGLQFTLKSPSDFNVDSCVQHSDILNTDNYWDCLSVKVEAPNIQTHSTRDLDLTEFTLKFDTKVVGSNGSFRSSQVRRGCGKEVQQIRYKFDGCNFIEFTDSNFDDHGYVISDYRDREGFMKIIYGYDSLSGIEDGVRVTISDVVYTHSCYLREEE